MFNKSNFMLIFSLILIFMSIFSLLNNSILLLEIPFTSMFISHFNISLNMDWMSLMFLSTVFFISSMIIKFSNNYISMFQHNMFINLMLMFILSMSVLIISDNIMFILLGWDGLGLSSYILVVYYQNSNSSASGSITILSNRIGDIMILLTIASMFFMLNWNFHMKESFLFIIMLFLLIAAMSKSAQFPFSAWLPAAMSAPTPISALVHSSTLVTAGVYLMIRLMNFNHYSIMIFLMIISSMTAIYASFSALWEQDMKKIIALSTLSQMAMMMFIISLNSTDIAFFHLISHALFKSMMFLCAGIIIHSFMYQDMRYMKSFMNINPITFTMLGISSLSLMGIPFTSGFFSKDSIIEKMLSSNLSLFITSLMMFSISLTSMYTIRMTFSSSKFLMKSKNMITNLYLFPMESSINFMFMFSIMSGAMFTWLNMTNQFMLFPNFFKIMITISIIMGMIFISSIPFKNHMIKILGNSSISMWYINMLSSNLFFKMYKFMNQYKENDKNWQEKYGPSYMMFMMILFSKIPNSILISSMCFMMMMFIIPMMSIL